MRKRIFLIAGIVALIRMLVPDSIKIYVEPFSWDNFNIYIFVRNLIVENLILQTYFLNCVFLVISVYDVKRKFKNLQQCSK